MAAAGVTCLLLLLSVLVTSEPVERQPGRLPCPAVCTCHQTPPSHVPLVRWHETGDRDHESQHHWDFYHHHEGLNHTAAEGGHEEEESVLSVVCVLQRETEAAQLMSSLPADTQFLSLLQAPDMQPTYLRVAEFDGVRQLRGLEIQGYHTHDEHEHAAAGGLHANDLASLLARADRYHGLLEPGAAPRSLITLSDSALRGLTRLEYLHLEHVLLSPDPAGPSVAEYRVEELDGASAPHSLLVEEQPRIVPYEEFRQRQAPRYSNFANLTALRFLRLAHAGLEEISWELFEGLDALRQLSVEHQLLRTVPDFAFYGCPNLRRLSLADNLLTINMKSFAGLLDLEELDLSNNLISELSYISLAPFPRLRELSLLGNPTQLVYSGALDMMNRTEVLRLGGADVPLELMPHALDHLAELRELTVANVTLPALTGVEFAALPRLVELELHGSVPRLEFDALRSNGALERLDLSRCHLEEVSQDAFLGLARLTVLDLSHNLLEDLPSEVFSPLVALREVYLHHNLLSWLSPAVLGPVRPKLLQIHHNPWECSCQLSFLSAAMTNKVRSSRATICRWDSSAPSGRVCKHEEREHLTYDVRVEPRCHQPEQYRHWGLYEVLRRELRCKRAPPPPTAARGGKYLTLGEADDADYQLIAADDVVLLDDPTEYEDYGEADAGYADEELAMAEYAADDYGEEAEAVEAAEAAEAAAPVEPALVTEGYATISPELFAMLSKKAQKLELERMNPKFRKHYKL
ncbi:insulin-like growth factor-binding protein complex acid labile subunit [Pollicipes pollicipes]|uniref:insulin-like growth factor-binding protein complex acid labile subunit n=1 Tax=Pollicipes pollicipes TaxID=41117 RepID=UPI001884BD04|nr:insulin-like growth factor-binding protein complex acid labile subunit [Pollicipes pollicipes]